MDGKFWWESRTLWFNLIALAVTVWSLPEVAGLVPTDRLPLLAALLAVGNMVLRLRTNEAIR